MKRMDPAEAECIAAAPLGVHDVMRVAGIDPATYVPPVVTAAHTTPVPTGTPYPRTARARDAVHALIGSGEAGELGLDGEQLGEFCAGLSDALAGRPVTPSLLSADRMRAFREDEAMRAGVVEMLRQVFTLNGYERPLLDEVIDEALGVAADDLLDRADDQATCNKVDECIAKAVVFRHLAEWLSPVTARRRAERAEVRDA